MLSSRSSHARVRLLEGDKESIGRRLIVVWAQLEKDVEDVVEDVVDEAFLPSVSGGMNGSATNSQVDGSIPTLTNDLRSTAAFGAQPSYTNAKSQPLLTPAQYRMIENLNTLPNLTKHVAFIDNVRNSHSVIVCRSAATMIQHRRGEGVLRAWADGMSL